MGSKLFYAGEMAPQTDLVKIGSEGFAILEQEKKFPAGRKGRPFPPQRSPQYQEHQQIQQQAYVHYGHDGKVPLTTKEVFMVQQQGYVHYGTVVPLRKEAVIMHYETVQFYGETNHGTIGPMRKESAVMDYQTNHGTKGPVGKEATVMDFEATQFYGGTNHGTIGPVRKEAAVMDYEAAQKYGGILIKDFRKRKPAPLAN
ncbi:hypothetical protein F0562_034859 [Nyssa sinensis]|uniref:Uncharacterized protein n=1 Tax=Nyssa sinensis TaxID=561372 RepID=A0A5J5ACD4_9ASTE|nr:hypothetical protein F0562_034859 [Nyssa sinensis]